MVTIVQLVEHQIVVLVVVGSNPSSHPKFLFFSIFIIFCKNCGKILTNRQNVYCCSKCKNDYEYKQYIESWKRGEQNGMKGEYSISNYLKRYLREKFQNKCCLCGWSEVNKYTNNIPLEVHHKDGNYLNNKEENLQLLCPNCHSLTENYKASNKNGRKSRKKYK